MDFSRFDRRNYPTVSPRSGYGEWAATYEESVPRQLDIGVLESLESVEWDRSEECLDLACGTGRTGEWLRAQGVRSVDGLDITPEMLERARAKALYRSLFLGSVDDTKISRARYDLIVMNLADEHLEALGPVYQEACRLSAAGAKFVVVGMHPYFFMTGMPTHFMDTGGKPKAIETHIHLVSDHVKAALKSGWSLAEMYEGVIDEGWVRAKPKWGRLMNHPVNFGYVWVRPAGQSTPMSAR